MLQPLRANSSRQESDGGLAQLNLLDIHHAGGHAFDIEVDVGGAASPSSGSVPDVSTVMQKARESRVRQQDSKRDAAAEPCEHERLAAFRPFKRRRGNRMVLESDAENDDMEPEMGSHQGLNGSGAEHRMLPSPTVAESPGVSVRQLLLNPPNGVSDEEIVPETPPYTPNNLDSDEESAVPGTPQQDAAHDVLESTPHEANEMDLQLDSPSRHLQLTFSVCSSSTLPYPASPSPRTPESLTSLLLPSIQLTPPASSVPSPSPGNVVSIAPLRREKARRTQVTQTAQVRPAPSALHIEPTIVPARAAFSAASAVSIVQTTESTATTSRTTTSPAVATSQRNSVGAINPPINRDTKSSVALPVPAPAVPLFAVVLMQDLSTQTVEEELEPLCDLDDFDDDDIE